MTETLSSVTETLLGVIETLLGVIETLLGVIETPLLSLVSAVAIETSRTDEKYIGKLIAWLDSMINAGNSSRQSLSATMSSTYAISQTDG